MSDGPAAGRSGRPLRVAVVAEWYPSPADPVHGIWAHRQAVAVARRGVEVQVLALRRPVPPRSVARRVIGPPPEVGAFARWARGARAALAPFALDGLAVHAVPWLGPPRRRTYGTWGWWMAPSLGVALDRLRAAWPFDVVHAHTLAPAGHATARWVRRARDRPAFVVSAHAGDMYHLPEGGPLGRRAVRAALGTSDLVIANSRWSAARCAEIAPRAIPTRVVHLGATTVPGADEASVRPRGRLRLITVAHLQARKRHANVLRALATLAPEARPDYEIVGDGEERDGLVGLVAQLGLGDRVTFTGQLPNEEAVRRTAAADLFVMPGVEEPFGVAFVEALAAGVPAVGSRGEGGPQDIAAAGEGMLLVAPDDVDGLVALIAGLDRDRDELARLSAAARATAVANFTWERCGEQTVAAYEQAVSGRRS